MSVRNVTADMRRGRAGQRGGRPRLVTERVEHMVVRALNVPGVFSARNVRDHVYLHTGVQLSLETVRLVLRANGLVCRRRPPKPRLTRTHKIQRLRFARGMLGAPERFWEAVVFSDECKVN
ncbi:hypothetical protein PAPHI01_2832, partial [Pancytospora philotis]